MHTHIQPLELIAEMVFGEGIVFGTLLVDCKVVIYGFVSAK